MPADTTDRRLIWLLIGLCLSSFAFGVTATLWLVVPRSVTAQIVPQTPPQAVGRRAGEVTAEAPSVQPTPMGAAGGMAPAADPAGAGAASTPKAIPKAGASAAPVPPPTVPPAPVSLAPVSPAPVSPASVPASAPPAASDTQSTAAADGFRLQFGGFLDAAQAQAVAAMLKDRGFHPTVVARKDGDGRDWQLVQVGRFSDAGSANLASSELARVAGLSPVIVDASSAPGRP